MTTLQTEAPYYKYKNTGANVAAKSKFENLLKVFLKYFLMLPLSIYNKKPLRYANIPSYGYYLE